MWKKERNHSSTNVNECFSAVGVARVAQIFSKQKDGKSVEYVVSFL